MDISKEVANPDQKLLMLKSYPQGLPIDLYRSIEQAFLESQTSDKDNSLKKLLISSLPASTYKHRDMHNFMKALRCLARSSHLFTVVTVPPIVPSEVRNCLLQHSDDYLKIERVGSGYDDFSASLTVLKESEVGTIRSHLRGQSIWGIKSSRREIRIEPIYEQPLEGEKGPDKPDF